MHAINKITLLALFLITFFVTSKASSYQHSSNDSLSNYNWPDYTAPESSRFDGFYVKISSGLSNMKSVYRRENYSTGKRIL
jgi:hypothetical protein